MRWTELIGHIPEAIWGVILGSVLAFGGTFVGLWLQLKHDAKQRERERRMQLRRDVFLEAAEGVAGSADYFMRFANVGVPLKDLGTSEARGGWLNKLYTVASLETIEAFALAGASLGAAAFDLFRQRIRIDEVSGQIDATDQQAQNVSQALERIREEATAQAGQERTPEVEQRFQELQHHWNQMWQSLESLGLNRRTLQAQKSSLERHLLESAVDYSRTYQAKLRRAVVALRAELELPLDAQAFETTMERIDADMLPRFNALLDAIQSDATASDASQESGALVPMPEETTGE